MSGIAEKIKETLAGHTTQQEAGHSHGHHAHEHGGIVDTGETSTTGTGGSYGTTTGAGPHSSSLANKLDPRVNAETGTTGGTYGTTGTTGTYGSTTGTTGYGSTGGTGYDGTSGTTGTTGYDSTTGTTGYGSSTGTTGYGSTTGTSTTGPHSSTLANKLDPRVNASTTGTTGVSGYDSTTGTTGTTGHDSTIGTTGYDSNTGTSSSTSGTTTGPHSSNLLNKLDPRVRKQSMDAGHGPHAGKDTFDAAQVPPSAFQKPAGHPSATMGSKRGSVSGI